MFAPFGGRSGGPSAGRSGSWSGGWGSGRSGGPAAGRSGGAKGVPGSGDWRPPEWTKEVPAAGPREALPAEELSQTAPRLVKGERVRHRKFGSGTILGLTGGGKDMKVTVQFADPEFGTKQLLVAYAGLERDDDWEGA